jgi:hypothetical protein
MLMKGKVSAKHRMTSSKTGCNIAVSNIGRVLETLGEFVESKSGDSVLVYQILVI